MPLLPFNSVGGYSTGITATAVIDSTGNITGVGATFSGLIRANAGISASGATFSGNISAPNIVTSVNGATGSVTTYAGTTGNIQFRYGSGITATSYFGLEHGELSEITDIFTISGPTTGSYSFGNQEAIGLRISRAPGGLALDEAGGLALNVLGIGDDGTLYGSSLQIITPTADLGSDIYFRPANNLTCIMTPYGVESVLPHAFAAGMYSTNSTAGNTFAGPITGVTATFTGLLSASKGISAAGGATFATDISVNGIRVGKGAGNRLDNVALGSNTLTLNTTGDYNLAIGSGALASNLTGLDNVGLGYGALYANTNSNNIGIGSGSLSVNSTGTDNAGVGTASLGANSTGSRNVAIGRSSLSSLNGSDNVGIGAYSLSNILSATVRNYNTAIGSDAGRYRTGGSSLSGATGGIYIGYGAKGSANAQTNEIVIGTLAEALGSNTAVIGATTQTAATIYGVLRLPGGLSAASGITLSGNVAMTSTSSHTGLASFAGGLSAAGATFSGNVAMTSTSSYTGLASFSGGLSAAGGVTFNTSIQTTRLPRLSSSVFEAKTANWTPTNADDGKIFTVSIGGKSTITCTLNGLSPGVHFKILLLAGNITFSVTGTGNGGAILLGLSSPSSTTVYCTATDTYFATDSA